MSLTVRVLIGLVAGLVVGFVVNASPDLRGVVPLIEPLRSRAGALVPVSDALTAPRLPEATTP